MTDAPGVVAELDAVAAEDLISLARARGPHLSILMPTHRRGRETLQGPIRLRNHLERAEHALLGLGTDRTLVGEIVAPIRELAGDARFWQHQAEGLALYSSPGRFRSVRVPLALDDEVVAGAVPRVRPLAPLLAPDGAFHVLALSRNSVRLYRATRHTFDELMPGRMPTSMDEALAMEESRAQLQYRSVGGDAAHFHGHGVGGEVEKAALERFFRAVDRGLLELIGKGGGPLVLACVDYYLPIYRSVTRHPDVLDRAVAGNPERAPAAEIHAGASELVRRRAREQLDAVLERVRSAPPGVAIATVEEVVVRACEGRVDTLLVAPGPPVPGRVDEASGTVVRGGEDPSADPDLLDRAILGVLTNGGRVAAVVPSDLDGRPCAALLRY